jgi:hypothetical protein
MAVEAPKSIFKIPVIKKDREEPRRGRKKPKIQKKDKKERTGRIDIKV